MFKKALQTTIWYLYRYKEIKRAIQEKRVLLESTNKDTSTVSGGRIGDPTALRAINHIVPLQEVELDSGQKVKNPELICEVIEYVINNTDSLTYKLAKRRFIDQLHWKRVVVEESISKSAYYCITNEFINTAMIFFIDYGVISLKKSHSRNKTPF